MREERGFTLIELMLVVALIGILASMAIPSMSQYMEGRRVVAAAEEIMGFIVNARSEAIARSSTVEVRITEGDSSTWAIGMEEDPAPGVSDCVPAHVQATGNTPCELSVSGVDVLRHILGTAYPGVSIADEQDDVTIAFDPVRGTANTDSNDTSIKVFNADGATLKILVSLTGRVKICRPDASGERGYSACP